MIEKLLVFDDLLDIEVIRDVSSFANSSDDIFLHHILRRIYKVVGISPFSYETYLYEAILSSENEFSLFCEKHGREVIKNTFLINTVKKDLVIIKELFKMSIKFNLDSDEQGQITNWILNSSLDQIITKLIDFYFENGCGKLHSSEAYIWDKGIHNVRNSDTIEFRDLIGYEHHKNKIINNMNAFCSGKPYNNILLFGDRGTGKSSCVKSAFNMFKDQRVRIIELSKSNISQIQDVMEFVRGRGLKFMLFLDDLSFEDTEYEYKELKAHLEGGLMSQPDNVVVLATSNRYHIVRETNSDNMNISDDIHLNDAIQEKLSLSDRFGITITFDTPAPKAYINIINKLLERQGIEVDQERLEVLAYRWELSNHGRSGRSAVQFIKSVIGNIDEDVKI